MPYEIPQNLKYKEKIAFGLTFIQLVWLALFSGLTAIIFFKTNLMLELKFLFALIFLGTGTGFAFFGLLEHLKNIYSFKKQKKELGFFDSEMKKFLNIKKIEENAVYLNDNSLRAIIEVQPINFGMLSSSEQKAVISAYKDFLNSIDYPIQITARTVNLSLDDYLNKLEEKTRQEGNQKLTQEMTSFREFIKKFIEENTIKNRLFYIIVPYNANSNVNPIEDLTTQTKNLLLKQKNQTQTELNKETALNQLEIRIELCREKLKRCNLLTKRLNTEELASLLASFFDGFIETKNNYSSILTLTEKFEEKQNQQTFINANGIQLPKIFSGELK